MEPAGLAVGIAGLAGLFTSIIDVINRVHTYRSFGTDSQIFNAYFEADCVRLERWGREIGLLDNGRLSPRHSTFLDPRRAAAVKELLEILYQIIVSKQHSKQKKSTKQAGSHGVGVQLGKPHAPLNQLDNNTLTKLKWAIQGKSERKEQVELFGVIVQKLHDLLPVDEVKTWAAQEHDVSQDHAPQYVDPSEAPKFPEFDDILEILNRIEMTNKGMIL